MIEPFHFAGVREALSSRPIRRRERVRVAAMVIVATPPPTNNDPRSSPLEFEPWAVPPNPVPGDPVGIFSPAHNGLEITFDSKLTWPLRASSRPLMVAPVFALIDVSAKTDPTNTEPLPSVAELVTCQNT